MSAKAKLPTTTNHATDQTKAANSTVGSSLTKHKIITTIQGKQQNINYSHNIQIYHWKHRYKHLKHRQLKFTHISTHPLCLLYYRSQPHVFLFFFILMGGPFCEVMQYLTSLTYPVCLLWHLMLTVSPCWLKNSCLWSHLYGCKV